MRQYFVDGFYPTGVATPANSLTPTNALMKAVLINTSRDMTGVSGYPNNSEGWGRVVLDDSLYFMGDSDKLWAHDQRRTGGITTGQTQQFTLEVLSSTRPLEVTLCFTDYAGTVNSSNPVVNNLNLVVTAPNGATYRGNVFSGGWSSAGGAVDLKNNVERVAVASPQAGTWTFAVTAASVPVGPSGFALCATGDVDASGGFASFSTFGNGCSSSVVIPSPPCHQWNATGGTLTNQTSSDEWVFRVPNVGASEIVSFELYCRSVGGGSVTVPARLYIGTLPGNTPIATTTMTVGGSPGFYTATFAAPVAASGTLYVGIDSSALNAYLPVVVSGNLNVGYSRTTPGSSWAVQVVRAAWIVNCAPDYKVPELSNTGLPVLGASFDVEIAEAPASTFAVLVQGLSDQVFPGGSLPVTLPGTQGCDILVSPDAYDALITSAAGATSYTIAVPNSLALIDFEIFYQWVVLDYLANTLGLVTSNGGKAKLGN